jgi:hypothetical protein
MEAGIGSLYDTSRAGRSASFALIATHDLLEPMFSGSSLIIGFVWTGIVGFVLWKRQLA